MITLVHITGRKNACWDWYCDAICNQASPEELGKFQFVFVDRLLWSIQPAPPGAPRFGDQTIAFGHAGFHDAERRAQLAEIVNGRFPYLHVPCLPNVYQGPFRLTKKDWFFAGAARNTGIVVATNSYVMYCDDLALPCDQWLSQVRHAAEHAYLLCGMYAKKKNVVVSHGLLVSAEEYPGGVDSRMPHGRADGITPWHGSGLFGCSFGAPLESLLAVDGCGYEVACQGADDYDLGIRLERLGLPVFLNKNCFTTESEEAHHVEPSLPRESVNIANYRLPAGYEGSTMSDHVHLNRLLRETTRILPLYPMGLRAIRRIYLETGQVPCASQPFWDWRTGTPLSEI